MSIDGGTRICALLGTPLAAAQAPITLNAAFEERGMRFTCIPAEITREGVPGFVAMCRSWSNLAGLVVTMPYKAQVAQYLDTLLPRAVRSGNVNVVRRTPAGELVGDQLDGAGMVHALRQVGELVGASVVIVGAGSVASAIAHEVVAAGASSIAVVNRSPDSARALVERLKAEAPGLRAFIAPPSAAGDGDVLINATSVGSAANPGLPIEVALVSDRQIVADVVSYPRPTTLIALARARGCRVVTGADMQRAQFPELIGFLAPDAAMAEA